MICGRDYAIVPFEYGKHGAFVPDSFRLWLRDQWPWSAVPSRLLLDRLKRTLASRAPRPGRNG